MIYNRTHNVVIDIDAAVKLFMIPPDSDDIFPLNKLLQLKTMEEIRRLNSKSQAPTPSSKHNSLSKSKSIKSHSSIASESFHHSSMSLFPVHENLSDTSMSELLKWREKLNTLGIDLDEMVFTLPDGVIKYYLLPYYNSRSPIELMMLLILRDFVPELQDRSRSWIANSFLHLQPVVELVANELRRPLASTIEPIQRRACSGNAVGGDRPSMNDPLPTGPASRQEEAEVSRPKLNLMAKSNLDAKPQSMEERKVEVDSSLTSKGVVSLADKLTPLESALEDNTTITEAQLSESMNRLKLDKDVVGDGNVLAKSLIDGTVSLNSLVSAVTTKQTPELLLQALSQLRAKKSDKFLLDLIAAAKAKEPEVDIHTIILEALLAGPSSLALKPIPDLSESVAAQIASGASPADILTSINSQVDAKLAPGAKVAGLIATSLFTSAFKKEVGKVDLELVKTYKALLQRVAPNSDVDAQLRVLFDAQYAWFNESKQAKAILKELFVYLFTEKIISAQSFDAYLNDEKETQSANKGGVRAVLQVHSWIEKIQPKQRGSGLASWFSRCFSSCNQSN